MDRHLHLPHVRPNLKSQVLHCENYLHTEHNIFYSDPYIRPCSPHATFELIGTERKSCTCYDTHLFRAKHVLRLEKCLSADVQTGHRQRDSEKPEAKQWPVLPMRLRSTWMYYSLIESRVWNRITDIRCTRSAEITHWRWEKKVTGEMRVILLFFAPFQCTLTTLGNSLSNSGLKWVPLHWKIDVFIACLNDSMLS